MVLGTFLHSKWYLVYYKAIDFQYNMSSYYKTSIWPQRGVVLLQPCIQPFSYVYSTILLTCLVQGIKVEIYLGISLLYNFEKLSLVLIYRRQ